MPELPPPVPPGLPVPATPVTPPAAVPSPAGRVAAWVCVVLSVLYLLNPDMGLFEFLPDNFPIVGNLDEVGATLLLLGCLDYLGIQLPGFVTRLFRRK